MYRVVGWQPRHDNVGVATLGDRSILPQELPIFDTLESLIICAHFMSYLTAEKPVMYDMVFIAAR